jgi:MFS superfamily sulfate permease-like transporter
VAAVSLVVVKLLGLDQMGVSVIGEVPAGLTAFTIPAFDASAFSDLFTAAAGLVLVSFTSGVLTAKSFARRNGYEINPNQELIAFGTCNLASGLGQGFPVTGADSRTAVNNAMGGKTQVTGLIAGGVMLLVVIFVTAPLAYVPNTALAAVILVSAVGLFDLGELRRLFGVSHREFAMSVGTTLGVLLLGVLPGVLLAIALSLIWLLYVGSRPNDAVLGRVKGRTGYHNVSDYREAKTIPGLLLYRFEGNVIFFNADYFKTRVRAAIAAQQTPVRWVVIDATPINILDATGLGKIDELVEELDQQGITVLFARVRNNLARFFKPDDVRKRREAIEADTFDSLKLAINADIEHERVSGLVREAADADEEAEISPNWRDAARAPTAESPNSTPPPAQPSPPVD